MCGIVGLYLKKKKLHSQLGSYLSAMLDNMSSRGPDSAGFAIYNNKEKKRYKYSLCLSKKVNLNNFEEDIKKNFKNLDIKTISDHTILYTSAKPQKFIPFIKKNY